MCAHVTACYEPPAVPGTLLRRRLALTSMFHSAMKHGSEWISRTIPHMEIQKVAIPNPSGVAPPLLSGCPLQATEEEHGE
jgi:hypothetical protein